MSVTVRTYEVIRVAGIRSLRQLSGETDSGLVHAAQAPVGARVRVVAWTERDTRTIGQAARVMLGAGLSRTAVCRALAEARGTTERVIHTAIQRLIRAGRIKRVRQGYYRVV